MARREHGKVDCVRILFAIEDETGARTTQRLVRGGGDDVALVKRGRRLLGGHKAADVRHVAHQVRFVRVGNLAL